LNEQVSSLTLMFCSQFLGKTTIIESVLGWMIEQAPCATVAVFPSVDNALIWSKNRFSRMIDDTPVLNSLVAKRSETSKTGAGKNTIVHKLFPGGFFVAGGSNSSAQLSAHTARITFFDEVDRYPTMVGKADHEEGDVILLVEQRSSRFLNPFSIKTSTPTVKGFSRIEKEYERSDKRRWFVKCPNAKCRKEFVIQWKDVKWKRVTDEKGAVVEENAESAYIECPVCARHISEAERQRIVRGGRWVAQKPKVKNRRGYHANAFLVLGPPKEGYRTWLHYFVQRYLDERELGNKGMREWQNLVLGETFELETDPPPDFLALHARRERYDQYEGEVVLPERVILLVCGIDVQRDRVELEIAGFGLHEESWGIHYTSVRGNVQSPKFWDSEVKPWIDKKWRHASGHWLSPFCTFIDTGDKPQAMYAFVRRSVPAHVYATKGYAGFAPNWVTRSGGSNTRLFIIKVDTPKESLYSNLRLTEPGPGYCHFPVNEKSGYDEVYFSQLTAEHMILDGPYPHFVKHHSSVRNEALDIRVLCLAAKEMVTEDPNYTKARAWLASPAENDWRPDRPAKPEPTVVVPTPDSIKLSPELTKATTPPPPRISPFRPPRSGWSRVR
jgi:phage terminase large subunit GpA-like protein